MMSYKLEYITRLFEKTSSKRIEHYVITRIWHKLDNYDIKMTSQQYVWRQSSKYALTDVYFPQIEFHVEIYEPGHYECHETIQQDLKRINEIKANTKHRVFVIDCRGNLDAIHSQIDNLVSEIKAEVSKQMKKKPFSLGIREMSITLCFGKIGEQYGFSYEVLFHTMETFAAYKSVPTLTKGAF